MSKTEQKSTCCPVEKEEIVQEKKEDRRIGRSRRLMQDALVALILEQGYEKITVQDILDRADIGRSTFYVHYRNKDELLLSTFEKLRTLFENQAQALRASCRDGKEPDTGFVLEFFRFMSGQHRLYKAMAGRQSGELMLRYLQRYLSDMLLPPLTELVARRKQGDVPADLTVRYLTGSLLSLLTWWLDKNMPVPPERMDGIFRMLTRPGIEVVLGREVAPELCGSGDGGVRDNDSMTFYSIFIDRGCCPEKQ